MADETTTRVAAPVAKPVQTGDGAPKVIGFVCTWAVSTDGLADAQGRLHAHPSVRIVLVPCSGFVRPNWLEDALRMGAEGAFVTGCPYGDCLNREGNYLMRDRVEQLERRLQRRRIPAERVAMLAHGLHDRAEFLTDVGAFVERLRSLPKAAPPGRAGARAAAPPSEEEG